jgi:diaminohydroxyphosphoribosylaminopyrimidine deaminase/5-amino-6-(5-phosphoribosylamino)uracil reductase
VRHLLLEGGPTLAGAFLDAGAVDHVVAYLAPVLLGAGPAALDRPMVTTLGQALRLREATVRLVGGDVRIDATPRPAPSAADLGESPAPDPETAETAETAEMPEMEA